MTFSLHVLGSRQGGGAERFFVRLVTALAEAGHRTEAVIPPGSWVDAQLPAEVVRHRIPMRSVHDLLARWRLHCLVRRLAPDIVQTWMGRATRLVRLPSGRLPVHVARLGGFYDLKGYRHAHAWVGNTSGIRDHLLAGGLPAERVFRIGNFVEPPRAVSEEERREWQARLDLPEGAIPVLALGRLHPNKGFDTLLRALARHPCTPPPVLILAGSGPLESELHALAGKLDLHDQVRWTGWVDDPAPLFSIARLFVCPSRHEPLGNVILEAWNHGLPVVSTACDGPRELITQGRDGLLVPPDDPDALGRALCMLTSDEALRQRLGEAGEARLRQAFSRERIVGEYLNLYAELKASVGQA